MFELQGHFDGKVLRQLIKQAEADAVRGSFPIAHGTPAEPGEDGRVELECIEGHLDTLAPALATDFVAILARTDLDEVVGAEVSGVTVTPGQIIARVIPPTEGTPGKDLLGQPLTDPGEAVVIEAGGHTRLEGDHVESEVFGYLHRVGDCFTVVPPVWVGEESTKAYFIHFPELLRHESYEPEWVSGALDAAGVTHGIDGEAIDSMCADWPAATEARAVLLASGIDPKDGEDTHVDFDFDPSKRAGAVRPDGSIDYRERNANIGVAAGQLIGKIVPATQGKPGSDVVGTESPAKDGEDKQIGAGENVTAKSEDGTTVFYSDIDGAISVTGDTIEVQPVYTISGDVDYETGNIDLPMNVEIGGSVKSEFKVKSGGSVTIGGVLEPGCEVTAAGDVVIANGVFGDTTRVTSSGNVETKMVQNSTVTAHGDLTVGSYIYNAIVRAGGTVTVEEGGGDRAGSIFGGEVMAGKQVVAKRIGSEETAHTGADLLRNLRFLVARNEDVHVKPLVDRCQASQGDAAGHLGIHQHRLGTRADASHQADDRA
ncbi:MAG: hypothetical protein CME04_17060 [Gemmatimonadaceae bacterium]|nr:hypothetical protein [Gemmatimonadaceae bacterium]